MTVGSIKQQERKNYLLAALEQNGAIDLEKIAIDLGVSAMTVRRDLKDLENEGRLRRIRGGAVPNLGPRSFSERRSSNAAAKIAIARKALSLVPKTGAIAVDASTTAATLGIELGRFANLTVATNSFETFSIVRANSSNKVILVGGEVEPATGSFVGPLAEIGAEFIHYQRFFSSAAAVHPTKGTSEVALAESGVKRAFSENSKQTILLVDSGKLNQVAMSMCLGIANISVMVTELDPKDSRLDEFRSKVELL